MSSCLSKKEINMRMFTFLSCEDYILNTIVKSSYAKNSLTLLITYLVAIILKIHLSAILSFMIVFNNFLDFVVPVIISLFISSLSGVLFKYVETHKPIYEQIVDYVIKNYSKRNFVVWKRSCLFVLFCYSMIVLSIVSIDNYFIIVSIIQTAVSYAICDCIENGSFRNLYKLKLLFKQRKQYKKITEETQVKCKTPPRRVSETEEISNTPPQVESRPSTPPRVQKTL